MPEEEVDQLPLSSNQGGIEITEHKNIIIEADWGRECFFCYRDFVKWFAEKYKFDLDTLRDLF